MANGNCSKCLKKLDGAHKGYCKACYAAYTKAKRHLDPEKGNAYAREWNKKNPELRSKYTRKARLKRSYGLTPEDFEAMMTKQSELCLICNKTMKRGIRGGDNAAIDHHHETGVVRGLLCGNCNRMIGFGQENPDILVAAAAYLLRWQAIIETEVGE